MKRKDAVLLNDPDPFHSIVPYVMPKRTEAEVSTTATFDITELLKFIKIKIFIYTIQSWGKIYVNDAKLFYRICYSK